MLVWNIPDPTPHTLTLQLKAQHNNRGPSPVFNLSYIRTTSVHSVLGNSFSLRQALVEAIINILQNQPITFLIIKICSNFITCAIFVKDTTIKYS